MADANESAESARRQDKVLGGMEQAGLVGLNVSLREITNQMQQAPGPEGEVMFEAVNTLHDNGVVNLDQSLKQALAGLDMARLRQLDADLICNSNFCLVTKSAR